MDILDTILTNTYTMTDLRHRIRILKAYLKNLLFGQAKSLELPPEDVAWLNALSKDFISQFSKDNLYSKFSELEKKLSSLSPLVVYLSFEPGREQIDAIGGWIKKNLTTSPLIEIKIDPGLLGGVALVNKGVYKDYSLRARIQQNGETILTEFKKYIR